MGEIGQRFDNLTARVADTAHTVASTTTSATDRVIGTDSAVREQIEGLLAEVEKGGKELARVSSQLFDSLRTRVLGAEEPKVAASAKKAGKKAKKKTVKRKPASKKTASKKTGAKKPVSGQKKRPSKQAATAKKKPK